MKNIGVTIDYQTAKEIAHESVKQLYYRNPFLSHEDMKKIDEELHERQYASVHWLFGYAHVFGRPFHLHTKYGVVMFGSSDQPPLHIGRLHDNFYVALTPKSEVCEKIISFDKFMSTEQELFRFREISI